MSKRHLWIPVLVGALGYFVDIFDLVMFSIVRVASLRELGVADSQQLELGVYLINCQMGGLLIGGVFWGILGDKKGRLSVLFGSILLYSVANILNAFVTSIPQYALLRFIAGIGLAGELGAAITLVSEILPKEIRGYGTAIVAGVGLSGAVGAGLVADYLQWRNAYLVGGMLGLLLLFLRLGIFESGLFERAKEQEARRGDVRLFLSDRSRAMRYLCCIFVGVPIWYCVGILMTFSPEIGRALGYTGEVTAGNAIFYCYVGIALGDIFTGFLSQWIKSRKKVVVIFLTLELVFALAILTGKGVSPSVFYALAAGIGFATGFWAVFVTIAAEQFGTNLRSTVTTSVPNFVRGSVVPMTLLFKQGIAPFGVIGSALGVLAIVVSIGYFGISRLSETHGRDLDFLEH